MKFKFESLISDFYEFVMVFLILAAFWIFFAQQMQSNKKSVEADSHFIKHGQIQSTERINEYIKMGHLGQRLKETETYIANESSLVENQQALAVARPVEEQPHEWGLKIEQENHIARIEKELEERQNEKSLRQRPEDRINARLATKQFQNEYEQAYNKAFVKEFKKKATDAGYQVELNENLDVVKLREINRPKPLLFE